MVQLQNLLLALLVCGIGAPKAWAVSERHLLLLEPIAGLTTLIRPDQLLYTQDGVSVVRIPSSEVERWSTQVHRYFGACGGFVDVSRTVSQGMSPAAIVLRELTRRGQRTPTFGFRIQPRASVVGLVDSGNPVRFWEFLTQLTRFNDRSATSETGVQAAQFVEQYAKQVGKRIQGFRTLMIQTDKGYPQPSVVAMIPGSDPTLGGIVLGGHLDTYTKDKPGADDDGSGAAAVMEALTTAAATQGRFKRDLYFIWYAAEERGLVGSSRVVQYFAQNKMSVRAAMQLDMVGYKSPKDQNDIYLVTDYTNDELTKTTAQLIQKYVGEAKVGYTACGYACSDHANWHRAGIPVVTPFEASFGGMNRRLHTKDDTMAFLSQAHAFRFVKTALAFLGELGELEGFKK